MSENLREGETWGTCEECRTPYVIEDLREVGWRFVVGRKRFLCRWHFTRRHGR
jgi:hypothetical protein